MSAYLSIVTQPRFRENSFYVKLTTFFTAENIKFDTNITKNSENSSKMNMRSVKQFSKFCLRQQLFAFKEFCIKTRLHNISKPTNVTNFTKTILESSYKVLLGSCNLTAPKRLVFLLRVLEF